MSSDYFWQVLNEAVSPRRTGAINRAHQLHPLQTVVKSILDKQASPLAKESPVERTNVSPFSKVVSNIIVGALSPYNVSTPRRVTSPRSLRTKTGADKAYLAIALGMKFVGGAFLTYLLKERIPHLYNDGIDSNLGVPPRRRSPRPSACTEEVDDSKCTVCCKDLSSEDITTLNCGHIFHTKCLYCCYLFHEVENKGNLKCPIKQCRATVSEDILEKLHDLVI